MQLKASRNREAEIQKRKEEGRKEEGWKEIEMRKERGEKEGMKGSEWMVGYLNRYGSE